ncbi:MAG: PEP-CTERM sorting domain-containing protein [Phenylobacterium sp.]|uniref:PEPxxWA-CTERM sorting domain-containing protein n=1 Tax=Phenylobacterium sp. TaxID=1871053 RepID=UPI0025D326D1|nr:PEPxxWA-CTERM sorting domain-containing protein [Phenylobacterium sp.]MBI1199771.1 PEP-CTERM sorting domain-containing protein [Phenylobacterium sp.]
MKQACLIAAALALIPLNAGATTLVNGGFETGDFTGWSILNDPTRDVTHQDNTPTFPSTIFNPVEGDYFATVTAKYGQVETPEGIFQELDFDGVATLSGAAALFANYLDGYHVQGIVRLVDAAGQAFDLFNRDTFGLGNYGDTGWITFSFQPTAGHYLLEAFTLDHTGDAQQSATLLLDAFSIAGGLEPDPDPNPDPDPGPGTDPGPTTPVPEPGVWAILITGFGLSGLALRRKRSVRAAT